MSFLRSYTSEKEVTPGFLNSTVFCSHFENGRWYCYLLLLLFSFALPVGILGNLAALVNYIFFRPASSASNVFLLNLALCDSAWILTLPVNLYFTFQKPHLSHIQIFCQFKKISFNVNIYGSILFLTLVSFDRYAGTVHPISSRRWWDVGKAKMCCVCTWVILIVSSIPDLIVPFATQTKENTTVCMDHIRGPYAYVKTMIIVRTVAGFLLPFGAMLVFYVSTARVLRRLPKDGRRRCSGREAGGRPLRLITAALLVFVVSFVPYHAMVITVVFMRISHQITPANSDLVYTVYEFFESMCSLNSCLDPVLYIMASERFQKKLLGLKWERGGRLCCRTGGRVGVAG